MKKRKKMKNQRIRKIGIIGLGYVGFITAVGFGLKGYEVKCVDIREDVVKKANEGSVPFFEPNLEDNLNVVIQENKFSASTTYDILKDTEVSFICVGTPSKETGEIDLKYIISASENIGKVLKEMDHFHIVVVKSTVVPTTTENVVKPILEKNSEKNCGKDFSIAMIPEFLREGNAMYDFLHPSRTVIGAYDKNTAQKLTDLFKPFEGEIFVVENPRTAEMIKYANNSFLALKVSFINEIANICRSIGKIDVNEVAKGIGLDDRISEKFLRAGCGFGGSCFPKDTKAIYNLAKQKGYTPLLIDALLKVNENQSKIMVKMLEEAIGDLNGKKIAILGLAFKPNTSDMREAPSIKIIDMITKNHNVEICAYDPAAMDEAKNIIQQDIKYAPSVADCIKDADACLIITEWDEFKILKPEFFIENMKTPIIIDGRMIYNFEKFSRKLAYYSIGRR